MGSSLPLINKGIKMKKLAIGLVLSTVLSGVVHAQQIVVCQTFSGMKFLWAGPMCPAGSFFVGY
jgi:hypothetical protein